MTKMIQVSEKTSRVRALFPSGATVNVWYVLQNGFSGCLLSNGSIDLRSKVKLTADCENCVWRIDRISARGNERFITYRTIELKDADLEEGLAF